MQVRIISTGIAAVALVFHATTALCQEKKIAPPPPATAEPPKNVQTTTGTEKDNKGPADRGQQTGDGAPTAAEMEEWMKFAAPGEPHKKLEPFVGRWTLTVKYILQPGTAPTETTGKAEFKWAMGGRFLLEEVKTDMMGQPVEWFGIHGYDNSKKKYASAWIDNMGTAIDLMDGAWDETTKTLTYTGEFEEPGTGEKAKIKWIMKMENRDKLIVEMFEPGPDGKEFRNMEIIGSRAP